jgi:hypothetical protein
MDDNKRRKLEQVGYQIKSVYLNADGWGLCTRHVYEHSKHDREHYMTIHRTGSCDKFLPSSSATDKLGSFNDFRKEDDAGVDKVP